MLRPAAAAGPIREAKQDMEHKKTARIPATGTFFTVPAMSVFCRVFLELPAITADIIMTWNN